VDPLENLHDITEVTTASWWPLAWGWWLAAIVVISLIISLVVLIMRRIAYNASARHAQALLRSNQFSSLAEVNTIAKRFALAYGTRKEIAGLSGNSWLNYMLKTIPESERQQFAAELKSFEPLLYQPVDTNQITSYQKLVLQWTEKAHV